MSSEHAEIWFEYETDEGPTALVLFMDRDNLFDIEEDIKEASGKIGTFYYSPYSGEEWEEKDGE